VKIRIQIFTKEERAVGCQQQAVGRPAGRPAAQLATSRWARVDWSVNRQKTESKLF